MAQQDFDVVYFYEEKKSSLKVRKWVRKGKKFILEYPKNVLNLFLHRIAC